MESANEKVHVPYIPSWIDRFIAWVGHLPLSPWLFYALAMIITGIIITITLWINRDIPVGSIDFINAGFGFFVFYWVGLYHYLTNVASRALKAFSPLLTTDEPGRLRIEYELTKLPRWIGRLVVIVGFGFGLMFILDDPSYGQDLQPTLLAYGVDFLITGFMISTLLAMIIRSIRQLLMVNKLHKNAANLNLYDLAPARAFSTLTARAGIGIIFAFFMAAVTEILTYGSIQGYVFYVLFLLVAIAVFILPVIGIRNLIEEEKDRALAEVIELLQDNTERLHRMIRSTKHKGVRKVDAATTALIRERDLINKISTWPWNPSTVRSFSSALLLPIFLLIVTRLLERVL